MKIFVAGATGAIGKRLVPLLASAGHQVFGMTRLPAHVDQLTAAGAVPVVADALDAAAVMQAVIKARPDVVVHELTAISGLRDLKHFDREFALTTRLRTEGTRNLLAAAKAAGAHRFIAQSYSGWPNVRTGGRVKTEQDPLDPNPPREMRQTIDAIRQLEQMVAGAGNLTGIVLRYGSFYGPGTSLGEGGDFLEMIRKRKLPIFGNGAGVWSFVHIDDAANATWRAIEQGPAGVYNVVDDEPVEVAAWLPGLSQILGAKPPYRLPLWLGKLLAGEVGVSIMTQVRGSSNAKAKRLLGWQPFYPTWRKGFRRGLSDRPFEISSLKAS